MLQSTEHPVRHNAIAGGLNEASDQLDDLTTAVAGSVPSTRSVTGTGMLAGGGTLAANRTLDMATQAAATVVGVPFGAATSVPIALTPAQVRALLTGGKVSEAPNTALPLTTVTRAGTGWEFLAGTLVVGTRLRISVLLSGTATIQTLTPTLKLGTANSNADTDLFVSAALGVGTAVASTLLCTYDIVIVSATTAIAVASFVQDTTTGVTNAIIQGRDSAGPITISNVSNTLYVAPYFSDSVASIVTVRSVAYEIL